MNERPMVTALVSHCQAVIAEGVRGLLRQEPGFLVVANANDLVEGDEQVVGLVIADYCSAMDRLAVEPGEARCQRSPILILTNRQGEADVRQALAAGAIGYVLEDCSPHELLAAARAVADGERYLAATVAQRLAESLAFATLTTREIGVLQLIVDGMCNKSIARRLDISVGTVKTHVSSILEKLAVSNRTQAIQQARARGLIPADTSSRGHQGAPWMGSGQREMAGAVAV